MTGKADLLRAVEAEVVAMLRRARRATTDRARLIDPALATVGYQVLVALRENPGLPQSALVEKLDMDKGAVSRQVHLLSDLGLVDKHADPEDRRACLVSLSEEGERRMGDLERERRSAYVARFDDWTPDELTVLADQLAKYNRTLEK
ncbi:MarR family winged helix-turn-helix transcriptional regulator [Nocardioides iriomotensis]|uniref:MarR family transcriptional regulator n=1 Tax=Nocardioides iriomotensis TaxID=715784 RepID=A0A4Q5J5H5_9ACTN|nr:MarR family transcriptional regulator [Nocardioides iriomotensis]RYU12715.1 MarR family transcriptional regulator [Nocardioides iriomotensis]